MQPNSDNSLTLILLVIILSLSITSCSKTPDVRLTLCQDLTQLLLNSPEQVEWKEHKAIMSGHNDLEMQLSYVMTQTDGQTLTRQASCFYSYEQDEIDAETFNTPTSAYSSYPNKMIIDNKKVAPGILAQLVNQAMLNQGKQLVVKTREGFKQVQEKAVDTYEQISQESSDNDTVKPIEQ